ncbi:MAG: TIGR02646 family protein [Thiothrix lacustris]|uniref:TIGR02646 family protein n=1 Tax=Thiothrix lacustris TaxID=525917 RepID=A0A1Y1QKS2_9GAMM|nr:MAG: TIGR02646 family protein [Thiothrix lacustris]
MEQAHANPPQTGKQATSRWSSFGHKGTVSNCLQDEQYGLCAYTELRPDQAGLGTHIEHVQPKSRYPQRTFDFSNLVLCALDESDLQTRAVNDRFGGHAKLGEYDPALFVSCLQNDCPRFFAYLSDGRVVAAANLSVNETQQAQYTIDLLNLNAPYLLVQRKNWLDELDKLIDEHLDNDNSLEDLAAIDLLPTSGKLSPFFSATRQRFARIADSLLRAQAPEWL